METALLIGQWASIAVLVIVVLLVLTLALYTLGLMALNTWAQLLFQDAARRQRLQQERCRNNPPQ